MQSHSTGGKRGSRTASNATTLTIPIDIPSAKPTIAELNAGRLVMSIPASVAHPYVLETQVYVQTAFDGTTPQLLVGTTATGNEIVASGDVTEGTPGFYPASNAVKKNFFTASTLVYVSISATDMTVGRALLIFRSYEVNTKSIS